MELVVPKAPKGKGKGKSGSRQGQRAKVLGPKLVCWIHVLDGKARLTDTSSQIGALARTWFPIAASPRHFPWKPVRGQRNCTTGSSPSRLLERAPEAWTRPISISSQFHVLSGHDDDTSVPDLGCDSCTDRPRMPLVPKRLHPQVRKKKLCPLDKNTQ